MFLSQYHFYCFPPAIFPPCSNLFLTSGQHESVLHLYMLVILEMFNKWNYVVCKLWELVFFTQGDFLEVHPGCGMCQELLFLLLHHVSMLWMHRSLLNHSHSERHLSSFHFWLLPKKKKSCYEHSCVGSCMNISFHFSGMRPSSATASSHYVFSVL